MKLGEKDATGRRRGILTMNSETMDADIPSEYRVDVFPTGLKAKVFSQDGSGRMAMEGTVQYSGNIMQQRTSDYSKLCKKRLLNSMVKDRYVKALEELPKHSKKHDLLSIEPPKPVEEEEEEESKSFPSAASGGLDKKVKMGMDELKNLVFHHFEEREFWPLKELNAHCRQPEVSAAVMSLLFFLFSCRDF